MKGLFLTCVWISQIDHLLWSNMDLPTPNSALPHWCEQQVHQQGREVSAVSLRCYSDEILSFRVSVSPCSVDIFQMFHLALHRMLGQIQRWLVSGYKGHLS